MEQWYALQTKPRKELVVRDLLAKRGIETFLPLLRHNGRRACSRRQEQPFFARYLFARVDLTVIPVSSINWMQGMTGVVSFDGQPAAVEDRVIHWLKARLAQLDPSDYHRGLPLLPQTPVRIIAGPLAGVQAIFDCRLSSADRARVLVQLLGRLTSCEIQVDWLVQV